MRGLPLSVNNEVNMNMEVWHTHLYTTGTALRSVGEVDTAAEVRAMADRSMSRSGGKNHRYRNKEG